MALEEPAVTVRFMKFYWYIRRLIYGFQSEKSNAEILSKKTREITKSIRLMLSFDNFFFKRMHDNSNDTKLAFCDYTFVKQHQFFLVKLQCEL